MLKSTINKTISYTLSLILYILFGFTNVFGITIEVPGNNNSSVFKDVNIPRGNANIDGNQGDIISLIKIINNYLWLSLGVLCLAVTIYGWYILITSQGDKAKLQKANQMILGAVIWLIICVMAYVIVRVVVNLFS